MYITYHTGQKIKITLPEKCYAHLKEDLLIFNIKLSQLIEAVIRSYCKDSEKVAIMENQQDTTLVIQALLMDDEIFFKKTIINLYLKKGNNTNRRMMRDKTKSFTWSITKPSCKKLNYDSRSHSESHAFISELLEDFSQMSFAHREKIVFAEAINDIQKLIDDGIPFEYMSTSNIPLIMHPYKILNDPILQYTYVIGHGIRKDKYDPQTYTPTKDNIKNIRLLNLRYNKKYGCINPLIKEKNKIDSEAINNALNDLSPAFISELPQDVIVEMSPKAEQLYRSKLLNRPRCISCTISDNEDLKIYTFRCTLFQAVIYFIDFDDTAKVISPPAVVKALKNRLERTLNMYK